MIKSKLNIVIAICFLFASQSCNVTKLINENEQLYTGAEIHFEQDKFIKEKKVLKSELESKLYPKSNKKFLGLFYTKLWIHLKVKSKKEKGFKHWLKNKFGEKPVYLSDVNTELMRDVIDKGMQDNGYFNTRTSATVHKSKKKSSIKYRITHGKQSIIDSIIIPRTNTDIDSVFKHYNLMLSKKGNAYNLEKLENDRKNLAKEVRSIGYFDFTLSDIYFVIDTSIGSNKLNLYFKIKQSKEEEKRKKYYVSTINVYPTFKSNATDKINQSHLDSFVFKNITFKEDYEFVGKRALYNNILIEKGDLFSVKNYEFTTERLNSLQVFNFVSVNYNKNEKDSLTVDVLLTPGKHQNFRADIDANTSNRSFLGSSVSLAYSNRNIFKGAENLTVKASAGTEFQIINNKATLNILDVNLETSLTLPRLIFTKKSSKIYSNKIPRTSFNFQENFQKWLKFYTLNSLAFSYRYDWQNSKKFNHNFEPLFVNIINLLNTTNEFDNLVEDNPLLKTSFNNNVIIGRNYKFSVSTQQSTQDKSYLYFSGLIENAGNEGFIISKIFNPNKEVPYKIGNTPFAQYTKLDADLRYYIRPNPFSLFVARFNPGIGIPYGNSTVLPYIKQFYMGGPNTLRSFQFRSVGPGNFTSETATSELNPIEQSGDIRLMLNIEYRFDIYKFIKGAFFADMGNVWLIRNDPNRPSGQFKFNEFYKQIALGSGFGLRLDFDFFVLRGDFGIPLHVPFHEENERWIGSFPEKTYRSWVKQNLVFNFAIGYPF